VAFASKEIYKGLLLIIREKRINQMFLLEGLFVIVMNDLFQYLKQGKVLDTRIPIKSKLIWKPSGVYCKSHDFHGFVPASTYKLGWHTPTSFANDPLVHAILGLREAITVAQASEHFTEPPYVFGFSNLDRDIECTAALDFPFVSGGIVLHAHQYINK
jgi:hypothetical protein